MASCETKAILNCNVEKVWELVTSLEKQMSWRSDLKEIEILTPKQFVEHTKDGYSTYFTIVKMEKYKHWQVSMENENLEGYWIYTFVEKGNQTEFYMTERATANKLLMKLYARNYLKSHQMNFIENLRNAIEEFKN